jgi:hypothetical protein
MALLALDLAFAPVLRGDLDFVAEWRGLLAGDVPLAFGFVLLMRVSFVVGVPTLRALEQPR